MEDNVARPTHDDDRDGWKAFWSQHGMPWRTEPEIDEPRKRDLAERLQRVKPDIEIGRYPFKDVEPKLTRADIEWLLERHENGRGPVVWDDPAQRTRWGLDLRGAKLSGADLRGLPLARLRGGLTFEERSSAPPRKPELAAIHLDGTDISDAHLEHACLSRAHLEGSVVRKAYMSGVDLFHARLDGATLTESRLDGADLRFTFLDNATYLRGIILHSRSARPAWLAGVRWGGADLSLVNWLKLPEMRDERWARQPRDNAGKRKPNSVRIEDCRIAVRANRRLASVLRDQGLNEEADRFAYRGQRMQREVLRRQGIRSWPSYVGSLLLDLLAGYGFRPVQSILVYLAVIVWFSNFYVWASNRFVTLGLPPSHVQPLFWYEALILSVSSFHGRGFQPFQNLNDPIAALASIEAVLGLVIEVSFIATFTQRFFAK